MSEVAGREGVQGVQGESPGAAAHTESNQMLLSVLVLQNEALRAHLGVLHRQKEAFVQQTGRHPLTFAPMTAKHEAPVALQVSPDAGSSFASGLAVSKSLSQLLREHCDDRGCLRSRDHIIEFLTAAKEQLKTIEDRFGALYVIDRTLQVSQEAAKAANESGAAGETVKPAPGTDDVAALGKQFEQEKGFDVVIEWFVEVCSYRDEPRRAIATTILQLLERNRPIVAFTRKRCMQYLRPMLGPRLIASRAVRARCSAVIELLRDP
jgi:hypothetical protein